MNDTISLFPKTARSVLALVGFVGLCLVVGGLGAALTSPSLEPWYAGLQKAEFQSAWLDFWPGLDNALYYDGLRLVACLVA